MQIVLLSVNNVGALGDHSRRKLFYGLFKFIYAKEFDVMFDVLEKCLESARIGKSDLLQLRAQKRVMTICTVKNGIVEECSRISLNGIGCRALAEGRSWGFSSTNSLDPRIARQTLENSVKLAKASSRLKKHGMRLEPAKVVTADISIPVEKPPRDFSIEDIAKVPLDAYEGTRKAGSRIADAKATYIGIEDDRYFLSSEGTSIHQNTTRVMLFLNVIAKSGSLICPASENLGHSGGMELFDEKPPYSLGETVAENAVKLLNSKAPPSGDFSVIIHPTLCATLLHEAIGHPLEADLAMSGGGFGRQMNALVSSKLITIYDDGHVKRGLGLFPYDDEGIECKHTVLIENGVLKSFMHDRTSAAAGNAHPTGNAHAWDYSVEPLIRQTNIGIEPGDYSLDEMVEESREGLLLEGTFGGQADSNANFTFGFQRAQRILHGRLGEELRGANVAGNAIEVFKTIDAVGKEGILRPGACGKYQFAVQGRVVPAIRGKITVGGTGGV
jgi:TldD protein